MDKLKRGIISNPWSNNFATFRKSAQICKRYVCVLQIQGVQEMWLMLLGRWKHKRRVCQGCDVGVFFVCTLVLFSRLELTRGKFRIRHHASQINLILLHSWIDGFPSVYRSYRHEWLMHCFLYGNYIETSVVE